MPWYDQPVSDRVKAMLFYAARNAECVTYWRGQPASLEATYQLNRHDAQATNCRRLAAEMLATGVVVA
jgi:hypothetical protein